MVSQVVAIPPTRTSGSRFGVLLFFITSLSFFNVSFYILISGGEGARVDGPTIWLTIQILGVRLPLAPPRPRRAGTQTKSTDSTSVLLFLKFLFYLQKLSTRYKPKKTQAIINNFFDMFFWRATASFWIAIASCWFFKETL